MDPSARVVVAFNDAINAQDLDALGALTTEDHRFVDSAGDVVDGREACLAAWKGFFTAFPDYRNELDEIEAPIPALVRIRGRSRCSVPELDGPARWRAIIANGLVAEWRVEADAG